MKFFDWLFFFYNYKKVGLTSYKSFSNYFFFYLHNVSMFCSLFPKTVPSILDPFMGVLVYLLFRAHDYEIFRLVNTSVTNFFIILKGKNEMVFFMSVLMSLFKLRQKTHLYVNEMFALVFLWFLTLDVIVFSFFVFVEKMILSKIVGFLWLPDFKMIVFFLSLKRVFVLRIIGLISYKLSCRRRRGESSTLFFVE